MSWTVQAPLTLETPTGEQVGISAWSLAGLEWPEDAGECPQTGVLSVPFQGVDVRFPVRLVQKEAGALVAFEGLSGRQRETLAIFYRSLLSGKMASSGEVITSLDTPVDLVPMGETEEEVAASSQKGLPAPLRIAINVTMYVLVAGLILSILGASLFKSVTRIDVQHGRVVAPIVERLPSNEGYVKSIHVEAGQAVEAGQILVRLTDPIAQGALTETRAKLTLAQKEYLDVQAAIAQLETERPDLTLETRGALFSQTYARFVGDRGFDTLWARWLKLRESDPLAAEGIDPFAFAIARLREIETALLAKVRSLRAARDGQKRGLSLNHVRAPSDGIVHEVLVRKGQFYGPKDLAVVFESNAPRVAMGWVSERYAETLFIGMPAQIGVNVAGERQSISGEVSDVRAGSDPRRPGEFGIIVTVTPLGMEAEETKAVLRMDAPVSLETRRPFAQKIFNRVNEWVKRNG
ncbi:HlyD family secretion protein [Shimia marina]|uniref:HlyD family secretion protein n=1 Tax=Shimia marina TaxID=321267 RepID=UPI0011873AF6|nr:HlyD family efflux transporter periplasmic adaptor subunit [Shimia marina]